MPPVDIFKKRLITATIDHALIKNLETGFILQRQTKKKDQLVEM